MLFAELMDSQLPKELFEDVNRLLELKMNAPEIKEIPRIDIINDYLDKSILEIKDILQGMENVDCPEWDTLNRIFLNELNKEIY